MIKLFVKQNIYIKTSKNIVNKQIMSQELYFLSICYKCLLLYELNEIIIEYFINNKDNDKYSKYICL